MGKYIGAQVPYGFFQKQLLVPDGVETEFVLDFQVGSPGSILVIYGGTVQEPEESYSLSGGGQSIVFSFIPEVGQVLYILYLGKELAVPESIAQNFVNYSPTFTTFGAMTYTNLNVDTAKYILEDGGNIISVLVNFSLDLTGGDNKIRLSLPLNNDGNINIASSSVLSTNTGLESGIIRWSGVDTVDIYRQFGVNYSADTWSCELNVKYTPE